jgi:hypothetical protein
MTQPGTRTTKTHDDELQAIVDTLGSTAERFKRLGDERHKALLRARKELNTGNDVGLVGPGLRRHA